MGRSLNVIIYYLINTCCSHKGFFFNVHTYTRIVKLELFIMSLPPIFFIKYFISIDTSLFGQRRLIVIYIPFLALEVSILLTQHCSL